MKLSLDALCGALNSIGYTPDRADVGNGTVMLLVSTINGGLVCVRETNGVVYLTRSVSARDEVITSWELIYAVNEINRLIGDPP